MLALDLALARTCRRLIPVVGGRLGMAAPTLVRGLPLARVFRGVRVVI